MDLKYCIEDKLFIYENVFDSNIINYIVQKTEEEVNNKNFKVRINSVNFNINKMIKELTEEEMYIYENTFIDSNKQNIEKYIEVELFTNIREKINNNISSHISDIYNIKNLRASQSATLIYNHNHYMMPHRDGGAIDEERMCTSVLYLNDKPENGKGGDVIFYNDSMEIIYTYTPKKGDLIIFDSLNNRLEKAILHSVTKIENWERCVYRNYWMKL
jgi:Rps23 Pro-64 3,4-dihydroxylase Tpa1-like proline 4-hydroxylase